MQVHKTIALVAHDNRKQDMVEWVRWNDTILCDHTLICTGTTGKLVAKVFEESARSDPEQPQPITVLRLKSGPLGGDVQLGALIAEGKVDILIFFWDPMEPHPHDVDVKALLRIAVVYNIPMACNRSSADFLISSPLLQEEYQPVLKDYSAYLKRDLGLS